MSRTFITIILVSVVIASAYAAEGEKQAGITTFDYQGNGNQGNRVVPFENRVDVCWTWSESEELEFPDRGVQINRWLTDDELFKWEEGGIKTSGNNKAGYPTMGVLPDGRSVLAYHVRSSLFNDNYYSHVQVEAEPDLGIFNSPVVIDPEPVGSNGKGFPMWPHVVVGSDGIMHVVARPNDSLYNNIYYSRSTDEGLTFSGWALLVEDADDAAIAVSRDGAKVAVAWVDKIDPELDAGHLYYIESADGGLSWNEPVWVTDDIYPETFSIEEEMYRAWACAYDVDAAYDGNNGLHLVFAEAFFERTSEVIFSYMAGAYRRIVHWSEETEDFSLASGEYGSRTGLYIDTAGKECIDTTFFNLALWGADEDLWAFYGDCGVWRPQLSFWGDTVVVTFGGNRNFEDISIAGMVNGEIFVTVSEDGGLNWNPLVDYNYDEMNGRAWWRVHRAYVTNITNTFTPDGMPGTCADEDYHSIWPVVEEDDILHLTYLKDLFSGPAMFGPIDGYYTDNPVIYLPVELTVGKRFGYSLFPPPADSHIVVYRRPEDSYVVEVLPVELFGIKLLGSNVFFSTVSFNVNAPGSHGSLKVYDASGALVKTLHEGRFHESQVITWDGTDSRGYPVSGGVYFYSFVSGEKREQGRLVLIR